MTILITGAAGFIGSHVAEALLARGDQVVGIDNLNDYYSVALKHARLKRLEEKPGFRFIKADVADKTSIEGVLGQVKSSGGQITGIVHLAAQAGVRYSLENPYAYADANVMGQVVMLEAAREPGPAGPFRLRQFLIRLWRQHQAALLDRRSGRSSGVALRRDQAGG